MVSFLVTIYYIWMERNRKHFQNKSIEISFLLSKMHKIVRGGLYSTKILELSKQIFCWLLCGNFLFFLLT